MECHDRFVNDRAANGFSRTLAANQRDQATSSFALPLNANDAANYKLISISTLKQPIIKSDSELDKLLEGEEEEEEEEVGVVSGASDFSALLPNVAY